MLPLISEGGEEEKRHDAQYHGKQVDEHVGVPPEDDVGLAADVLEFGEALAGLGTHHVNKVRRQHEWGALSFDTKLPLDIPQEVAKVDIWDKEKKSAAKRTRIKSEEKEMSLRKR